MKRYGMMPHLKGVNSDCAFYWFVCKIWFGADAITIFL